ncbi:MAG: tail fiber domain-containing protein [Bdellovibrionaceae bacterium]|nr:tail fiber domain-containing protein [Pseudobdellovibrionaceae bacterium]
MSAPKAPDPTATANAQMKFSTDAAAKTQQMNQYDQTTPFGSLSYTQSGTNPDGTPKYSVNQQYSPEVQSIISTLLGKGQTAANTDLSGDAITSRQMDLYSKYYDPINQQKTSALEAELYNKGIRPGSKAYENAMNLNSRNVNDQLTNYLMQSRGQALNEATTQGMFPYQQLGAVVGAASPNYAQTPQVNVQTPDYQGAVQNNYNAKTQQYNNMMSGLFSVPSTVLGGWARGGFQGLGAAGAASAGSGLGSAAASMLPMLAFSDRRLKSNISMIGKHTNGLNVYEYDIGGKREIGFMADEVRELHPDAVHEVNGYLAVDYAKAVR